MKVSILKLIVLFILTVVFSPFFVTAQTGGTTLVNSSGTSPFIGSFNGISLDGALTGVVYNKLATGTKTTVEIYTGTANGAQGTFLGATTTNFPSPNWNTAYGATGTNIFKFFIPDNLYNVLKKYFVFAVTNGKKYQLNNSPKDLTVARPVMCVLDGVSYAGGSIKRFYSKNLVNSGEKCTDVMVTKRCENGNFVGTAGYEFTSCSVKPEEYEQSLVSAPANDAVEVPTSTTLTWTNNTHNTFAIYLGIDSVPDSSEFRGYVTNKSFTPTNLLPNQKYYWRVDSVNAAHTATTTGIVWNFKTKAYNTTVPSPPLTNIDSGQVLSGTSIVLTASTNEEIYYTLNLQDPVCGQSTKYTSPITINSDTTIKTVACDGSQKSDVLTLEYKIANLPDSVRATPPPQRFSSDLEISFDTSESASIFYTTNGSTPQCDIDEMYLPDFKPYIFQTTTFKVIACNSLGQSQVSTFIYEYFSEPFPIPIDIVPDPTDGNVIPDIPIVDPGQATDTTPVSQNVDDLFHPGFNMDGTNTDGELTTGTKYTNIVVSQTADSGEGTLRAAIEQANNFQNGEIAKIVFNLPKNNTRICPRTQLPTITASVNIDGGSQPDFLGKPIVLLDGSCMTAPGTGLILKGENSIIKSLVINNFKGDGIYIEGGGGHKISGNFIGTNYFGQLSRTNGLNGVQINKSNNNVIGGSGKYDGNLISGNKKNGIYIRGGSLNNKIINNTIGLNITKTLLLPNLLNGISILESPSNTIGGDVGTEKNTIAGNFFNGIYIFGRNANDNNILGNDIDNNKNGISLMRTGKNLVGSQVETSGNTIKKNTGYGVLISYPSVNISVVSDTNLIQENTLKNIRVIR